MGVTIYLLIGMILQVVFKPRQPDLKVAGNSKRSTKRIGWRSEKNWSLFCVKNTSLEIFISDTLPKNQHSTFLKGCLEDEISILGPKAYFQELLLFVLTLKSIP